MACCEGAGDDRGVSSSRWRKTQARWQADDGRALDLAWAKGWEHCCAPDWTGEETERAIDADRANVHYRNAPNTTEDAHCLDSSPTADTI